MRSTDVYQITPEFASEPTLANSLEETKIVNQLAAVYDLKKKKSLTFEKALNHCLYISLCFRG